MRYKINELASLAGVSTRTLRYYDQIGLLVPKRLEGSNYRFYDRMHVDMLQQILLFKEMGVELKEIKELMKTLDNEKRIRFLYEHLVILNKRKIQIERLEENVKNTIEALKGEKIMSDKNKFEGLKDELIKKNDDLYKDEVISRWGSDAYNKSVSFFKNLSEEQFKRLNSLNEEIFKLLAKIKEDDNEELKEKVANLHKEWISITWQKYDRCAHLNVVDMYLLDERFKNYYDSKGEGFAQILRDSVYKYI